jgi:predicted nucleotidyltransferase
MAAVPWDHIAVRHPGLSLLVLIGSRALGVEHERSDWDFGALGTADLDLLSLRADLSDALRTDAVDMVDLRRASAVLRRDAATSGRVLVERTEGAFVEFQVEAISFWCDVEPVLREAHADVLRAAAG